MYQMGMSEVTVIGSDISLESHGPTEQVIVSKDDVRKLL